MQNRRSAARFVEPMIRSQIRRVGGSSFSARHRASSASRCRSLVNSLGHTLLGQHEAAAATLLGEQLHAVLDTLSEQAGVVSRGSAWPTGGPKPSTRSAAPTA